MSDKASSDLDIFDGLAAKKSRPAPPGAIPSVPPPPGSRVPPPSMTRQKTLLGLSAPGAGPIIGRPPGAPPPPPPSLRPQPPIPAPPSKIASPPPPPPPLGATGIATPVPPPPPGLMSPPPPPPPPPPIGAAAEAKDDETTPAPAVHADSSKKNGAPKPGVDIDWDDEDEATTVFDRTQEDALRSLLRSAPPPPPPAAGAPPSRLPAPAPAAGMPAASRVAPPTPRPSSPPPPSLPRAPLPPPPRTITSSMPAAPLPTQPPVAALAPAVSPMSQTQTLSDSPFDRGSNQKRLILVGAAAFAVVLLAVVLMWPKAGSLVVTVAGPGNKAVSELEVLIDGKKVCTSSPCQHKDLGSGIHLVKVTAPGYQSTADQAVKIASGDEAALNVVLTRGAGGSGLSVRSEGRGLKLFVDGKEIGPLPQELPDLAPGDHQVKIDGGDRYEPFEKSVTVSADQMLTLEPKLKVKKGLATIKPGLNADGARVVLVSGSERRPVPALPLAVDIPGDKPYSVVATKRGFQDFEQKLEFEDGQAERPFVIDMVPPVSASDPAPSKPSAAAAAPAHRESHSTSPAAAAVAAAAAPAPAPAKPAAPAAAAGTGTLTLNSIPVSNVILDGRPLGPTPKLNVSVPAGNHTVIFVHPEKGRKAKSVTVAAGKSVPVVVKF
ncbi:MAG: PEGA domain-containing protein [Polyangiaceae bacterium]